MSIISIEDLFTSNINKFITCCFTGHRPHKLLMPCSSDEYNEVKQNLKEEIKKAIAHGYKIFICGGGLGVDMYAAQIVLELKKTYSYIKLHLALPCYNHMINWQKSQKQEIKDIMERADIITYVSQSPYFDGCMQIRNKFMVNNSSMLIAVYNNSPGGTRQTIEYANKNYIDIVIITPQRLIKNSQ